MRCRLGLSGAALLATAILAACGSPGASTGGASASTGAPAGLAAIVTVTLTNASCVPDRATVPAGSLTFHVINVGGDAVSEVELAQDGRALGEKEDLAPGLSGDFTLQLTPGAYQLECSGAATPETPFTVTEAASPGP